MVLGSQQGTLHAEADIGNDIDMLMALLAQWNVYKVTKGRELDEDEEMVTDVISAGLISLKTGTENALADYNAAFSRLQKRRHMAPVDVDDTDPPHPPPRTPSPTTKSPTSSHPNSPQLSPSVDSPSANGCDPQEFFEQLPTAPVLNSYSEQAEGTESVMGEFTRILDDIENIIWDPTLLLSNAEDVDLEMDNIIDGGEDNGDFSDDDGLYEYV